MIVVEFNTFFIRSFKFLNFLPIFSTLTMETCAGIIFHSLLCGVTSGDLQPLISHSLLEQRAIFPAFWKSSSFQREVSGHFELQTVFPDSHSLVVLDLGSWPVQTPGFPDSSAGEESACNAGDLGSIPGLGRSAGEGIGYPLQHSGLENSMDYTVHGVAKSWTRLSDFHSPAQTPVLLVQRDSRPHSSQLYEGILRTCLWKWKYR